MNMSVSMRNEAGFSLLEVLVAIVVFAVGLLAIASLQGSLMQSGSDAKARTVATSLAEEQIEQMRTFLEGDDFDLVAGGNEEVIEGGVDFHRTTTVTDYYYAKSGGNITLTQGTDPVTGEADAKLATVTVSWCDAESGAGCDETNLAGDPAPNTVVVEDVISRSSSPVGSARALSELTPSTPPNVPYDPGEAPEVVSVDLGDGKKRETPEPTIKTTRKNNQASDDPAVNTVTRLETITFTPPPTGEQAGTVRRQEFIAVNCTCALQSAPADAENYGKTPYYWNGTDYVGGERVSKPVGSSTLGNSDNTFLSAMCSDCCRDHHDVPGESIMYDHDSDTETADILSRFDPFRKDASGNPTQHQHYAPNNQDVLELADSPGDEYLESCRFVRVDGELRVANDFRLESLQTLPANTCSDFSRSNNGAECTGTLTNESSAWLTDYRNYVTGFVSEYVDQISSSNSYPGSTPLLTDGADGLPSLPTTDTTPNSGEARELVSRAIYIDYLTPDLLNRIACRNGGGTDCDTRRDASGEPILPIVPFYEVNVQLQANWAVRDGDLVGVTSFPVDDDGYNRGFVYPVNTGSPATEAVASIEQGNVGLTDTHDVYPDTALIQDGLTYGSGGGEPSDPIIAGRIIIDPDLSQGNKLQPSDVVVTNQDSDPCTVTDGQDLYECAFNVFAAGQVVVTGYTKVKRKQSDGSIQSISDALVCIQAPDGSFIEGVNTGNGTENDTTTFTFDTIDPAADRTGYNIIVEPQSAPDKCTGGTI